MSNELTTPSSPDLNSMLFEYRPTGASIATARPDKLVQKGITGVAASNKMAEMDFERVFRFKELFVAASRQFNVPPALLAAIASRESRGGNVLKDGWGDHHHGYGLMQVDDRSHHVDEKDGPFGLAHILQATGILRATIDEVARRHPDWPPVRQLQGGVAGYNEGAAKIHTLDHMDIGSTGDDYSNDVWARAQFYAAKMGSVSAPPPAPASTGPSSALSFPAPTLADVLAGASVLARHQKGDAVLSLQNALIKLGYLLLTDEVKSGLGNFGSKTFDALVEFQNDAYLTGDGRCDATTFIAISQILSGSVRRGNHNQVGVVCRLHDRLVARGLLTSSQVGGGYGNFGQLTEGAVRSFQQTQGQSADGVLTLATYLALRSQARNPAPAVSPPTGGNDRDIDVLLPRGGAGFIIKSGSPDVHQYGTQRTINRFLAFASEWATQGAGQPIRAGEISKRGGGLYKPHVGSGHSHGIAVDIGLFRKDKHNDPTNYHDPSYDRELTRKLVEALDGSSLVSRIIFNDPEVRGKKLSRDKVGHTPVHHNHLHVEFS